MLWWEAAKHGLNVRCKGGHVGHHHHHIGGLPLRMGIKPRPQLVVQNFNFTLRRMRLHHAQTAIVRNRFRRCWHVIQIENVRLNFLQACGRQHISGVDKKCLLAQKVASMLRLVKTL